MRTPKVILGGLKTGELPSAWAQNGYQEQGYPSPCHLKNPLGTVRKDTSIV